MNTLLKTGKLWVVATPLGNPGDLSPRAKEILGSADVILAEDTRRAGVLLSKCGVNAKFFVSFHDHNEEEKLPLVLDRLQSGEVFAVISDAGTPLLSDPGFRLVRACRKLNIPVSPIPGPSAPVTALCASGIAPLPFVFLGFSPRKKNEQEHFFSRFASMAITLIFFERKDRIKATLENLFSFFGDREGCIARELTKTYEEFIPFRLSELGNLPETFYGELTVIIAPPEIKKRFSEGEIKTLISKEESIGGKPKDIARRVHLLVNGWTSKEIYELMQRSKE